MHVFLSVRELDALWMYTFDREKLVKQLQRIFLELYQKFALLIGAGNEHEIASLELYVDRLGSGDEFVKYLLVCKSNSILENVWTTLQETLKQQFPMDHNLRPLYSWKKEFTFATFESKTSADKQDLELLVRTGNVYEESLRDRLMGLFQLPLGMRHSFRSSLLASLLAQFNNNNDSQVTAAVQNETSSQAVELKKPSNHLNPFCFPVWNRKQSNKPGEILDANLDLIHPGEIAE